ncbi:MAG: hypothetical protein R3E66_09285 [bacterium]
MHRLITKRWMGRGAAALLCLTLLGGCANKPQQVRDTPTVETIRLNITKVRNAIEETRATIAVSAVPLTGRALRAACGVAV